MFSFLLIYFVILYMVFLENCPLHKENVDPGDARLCVLKHMLPYWFSCLNLASVTPEVLKSPMITVLQSVPVFCFINRYFSHMNLLQCWVQMYLICTLYYSCWSLSQAMVKKKRWHFYQSLLLLVYTAVWVIKDNLTAVSYQLIAFTQIQSPTCILPWHADTSFYIAILSMPNIMYYWYEVTE